MRRAPRGAVTTIESTATERMREPDDSPIASGTPPMAACTVALGRYEKTVKRRSFRFRAVPERERMTPSDLTDREKARRRIAGIPALSV